MKDMQELMDACHDGTLTEEQSAELQAWLSADPANAERFAMDACFHHQLQTMVRARRGSEGFDGETETPRLSIFSLRRPFMRYALAASLILCVGVIASLFNSLSVQFSQPEQRLAFATLTDAGDAVFENSDLPTDTGSRLPGGFLRLKSGTAHVEFDSGARVTISGPAEFGLNSEMRGYLKFGKVTAYCPPKAHGFTISARGLAVVDLGTEFLVHQELTGATEVKVLKGRVELQIDASEGKAGQRMNLVSDQTAMVNAGAVDVRKVAPQPMLAVSSIPLGVLFEARYDSDLATALSRDTYKATASAASLAIEKLAMGGTARRAVGGNVMFDFTNAGWSTSDGYGSIANAAWSGDANAPSEVPGGIRTTGQSASSTLPRTEPGIGMHADAMITFDIERIRNAGPLAPGPMRFRSERAGINDGDASKSAKPAHVIAIVSNDQGVLAGYLDGQPVAAVQKDGAWAFIEPITAPMKAGHFASFDIDIPASARYLTLATTAPQGNGSVHTVFSGARLNLWVEHPSK